MLLRSTQNVGGASNTNADRAVFWPSSGQTGVKGFKSDSTVLYLILHGSCAWYGIGSIVETHAVRACRRQGLKRRDMRPTTASIRQTAFTMEDPCGPSVWESAVREGAPAGPSRSGAAAAGLGKATQAAALLHLLPRASRPETVVHSQQGRVQQQPAPRQPHTPPIQSTGSTRCALSQAPAKSKVPEDAHEYHIRGALKDAAFQSLQVGSRCSAPLLLFSVSPALLCVVWR